MFGSVGRLIRRKAGKHGQSARRALLSTEKKTQSEANVSERNVLGTPPHSTYGQPSSSTHPHLLKEGELLPGVRVDEFQNRRKRLMENIVTQCSDKPQIVVIPSSSKVYMSDKIPYVFRQNTDFLYLTGCQEPDSILVVTAKDNNFGSTLFLRQKDVHSELWDGPRTGIEAGPSFFGVEQVLPIDQFTMSVGSWVKEWKQNIVWYDNINIIQPDVHEKLCQLVGAIDGQFVPPTSIMHRMRLIKSQCEMVLMKKTCDIASAAIIKTIQVSKPGMSEHQLFATVDYECRMNGAQFLAYPPVVAGGINANIIHYINNNQILRSSDMVLMDAGCEYYGYSSDITRTWPVGGKFTSKQRILYEIVLDVQKVLIETLKDMPTLDQLFHKMCNLLGHRLQEIGLIPKHLSGDKLLAAAYSYCPHHVSHYLGMDVHDTGEIPRKINVEPGMVVTVEPGIYVNPRNKLAPPEFHGLGIRIEDDVSITQGGPVVLTSNCPKSIDEIEALARENQ